MKTKVAIFLMLAFAAVQANSAHFDTGYGQKCTVITDVRTDRHMLLTYNYTTGQYLTSSTYSGTTDYNVLLISNGWKAMYLYDYSRGMYTEAFYQGLSQS